MLKKLFPHKNLSLLFDFGLLFGQDDESGVKSSQDLYVAFDQTSGNTNNLVSGVEYSYSLSW